MKRNYIKEFLNCKTHNVKYSNQYPAAIDAQTYKNTLCNMISEKTLEICIMTKKCFICVKVERTSNRIWSTSLTICCTYKIIEFKIHIILTIKNIQLGSKFDYNNIT